MVVLLPLVCRDVDVVVVHACTVPVYNRVGPCMHDNQEKCPVVQSEFSGINSGGEHRG